MTFDCSQRREQDDQSYLTRNNGVLHDAILEGQFAMRSALQHDSARPVRGILAFNLPSLRSQSRHPHGTANHDELVAEPEPDFTRSWVSDHQARQREFYAAVQGSTSSKSSTSSTPVPTSPLEYLNRPNVRGIRLENARPSHIGLELLWFLRSLTNGDVRKICLALEQTLWWAAMQVAANSSGQGMIQSSKTRSSSSTLSPTGVSWKSPMRRRTAFRVFLIIRIFWSVVRRLRN